MSLILWGTGAAAAVLLGHLMTRKRRRVRRLTASGQVAERVEGIKELATLRPSDEDIAALADHLGDASADVRRTTATALGSLPRSDAVALLFTALADPDLGVRRAAAASLARLNAALDALDLSELGRSRGRIERLARTGDPRLVQPFVQTLLADAPELDAETAAAMLRALRVLGDRDAVEPLLALLGRPGRAPRDALVELIGALGDSATGERLITALLQGEPDARELAARGLGALAYAEAEEALSATLNDGEGAVRAAAASALAPVGGGLDALAERLPLEEEAGVRRCLVESLGRLHAHRHVQRIIDHLGDEAVAVRAAAAEAAGLLAAHRRDPELERLAQTRGDVRGVALARVPRAAEALIRRLEDPDPEARAAAAAGLAALAPAAAHAAIAEALDAEEDVTAQGVLALALGAIGGDAAAAVLGGHLLRDVEPFIRAAIATALGLSEDAEAAPPILLELLDDSAADVRLASARALLDFPSRDVAEAAIAHLGDPDLDVRRGLCALLGRCAAVWPEGDLAPLAAAEGEVEALGRVGDSRLVEPLCAALTAPRPSRFSRFHQVELARALGALEDERAAPALIAALGHPLAALRQAAAEALARIGSMSQRGGLAALGATEGRLEALGSAGDSRLITPLLEGLDGAPPDATAVAMIEALGAMPAVPAVHDALLAIVVEGGRPSRVRLAAARALEERVQPRAAEALARALGDAEGAIRDAVLIVMASLNSAHPEVALDGLVATRGEPQALGSCSDPRAGHALRARLRDPDPRVRARLLQGTHALEDAESILIHALGDPERIVREAAAAALGRLAWSRSGEDGAGDPALLALSRTEGEMRGFEACEAPEVQPALERILREALGTAQGMLREICARRLGALGDASARGVLVSALADTDGAVRKTARSALDELYERHPEARLAEQEERMRLFDALIQALSEGDSEGNLRVHLIGHFNALVEPFLNPEPPPERYAECCPMCFKPKADPGSTCTLCGWPTLFFSKASRWRSLRWPGGRTTLGPSPEDLEAYEEELAFAEVVREVSEPLLLEQLGWPSSAVRRAAAEGLQSLGGYEAVFQAYGDVGRLGQTGDRRVVAPLMALHRRLESSYERRNVLTALGHLGDPRALDPIIAALEAEGGGERGAACEALHGVVVAERERERATRSLLRALEIDAPTRSADEQITASLLTRLRHLEPDRFEVRVSLLEALARLEDDDALAPLLSALCDPSKQVRRAAAEGLAEVHEREPERGLEPFATSRGELDRLVQMEDARVRVMLEGLLQDPSSEVRQSIVSAYQYTQREDDAGLIIERLADPDHRVRMAAANCLRVLAGTFPELELEPLSMSMGRLSLLGDTGDVRLLEPLMGLLRGALLEADEALAVDVIEALGRLEHPSALDILNPALKAPQGAVRESAERARARLQAAGERRRARSGAAP